MLHDSNIIGYTTTLQLISSMLILQISEILYINQLKYWWIMFNYKYEDQEEFISKIGQILIFLQIILEHFVCADIVNCMHKLLEQIQIFNFRSTQFVNKFKLYMKNLAYIPTKEEKAKLYRQIENQIMRQDSHKLDTVLPIPQQQPQKKQLSKQQLNHLLTRLTKNTKKQYDIQQQITNILSANVILKRRRQQSDKVENRLIEHGKKTEQKKIELGKQLQKTMKDKYYRQIPEITKKGKNIDQKPLDRRLNQIITDRLNKQEQLKQKYQPTFKPQIDPHSQFINDIQNSGNLQNRMHDKERQAQKRKSTLMLAVENKTKEECTFKPVINQKSKDIAESMQRKPIYSNTQLNKKDNYSEEEQQSIYPFAPEINKKSSQLIKQKGQSFDPNCFKRLYNNAKQISIKHEKKIQQKNNAYSYRPSLNSRSLKIVNSIPKKAGSRLSINDSSDEEYQEIRIGNGPQSNFSRVETYSVRNSRERTKQQLDKNYKNWDILYKSGKLKVSNIR